MTGKQTLASCSVTLPPQDFSGRSDDLGNFAPWSHQTVTFSFYLYKQVSVEFLPCVLGAGDTEMTQTGQLVVEADSMAANKEVNERMSAIDKCGGKKNNKWGNVLDVPGLGARNRCFK